MMQTKPIVVHDSAGVGRTGAFIAFRVGLERLRDEGKVDLPSVVKHLRTQRMSMVQTQDQLEYAYRCIIDIMEFTPPPPVIVDTNLYVNVEEDNGSLPVPPKAKDGLQ